MKTPRNALSTLVDAIEKGLVAVGIDTTREGLTAITRDPEEPADGRELAALILEARSVLAVTDGTDHGLAPCPFCGSNNVSSGEVMGDDFQQTACLDCGACGPEARGDDEADVLWNQRSASK